MPYVTPVYRELPYVQFLPWVYIFNAITKWKITAHSKRDLRSQMPLRMLMLYHMLRTKSGGFPYNPSHAMQSSSFVNAQMRSWTTASWNNISWVHGTERLRRRLQTNLLLIIFLLFLDHRHNSILESSLNRDRSIIIKSICRDHPARESGWSADLGNGATMLEARHLVGAVSSYIVAS